MLYHLLVNVGKKNHYKQKSNEREKKLGGDETG